MTDAAMTEEKARLYKTAFFNDQARGFEPMLTHQPVRVEFMAVITNVFDNVDEPVFAVHSSMSEDSFIGYYFARALKDFVL